MKRRLFATLLTAGIMVGAFSAQATQESMLNVEEHTLPNGLQVLLLEDHSAPLISYQVYVRVGSRNEAPGTTGLAHFFEHMMFRGSKKYAPEEHAQIVKAHGGTLNATTSYDRTAFFENISSEYLELVIHLEAERQANLGIIPEVFEPERQVVIEERRQRVDNNLFGAAREQLFCNVFMAHPYNWPILGWMSDMQNWHREDMVHFYKTFYAPNNATVILAGDFDPAQAMELIEKYYGKMEPKEQPLEPRTVEPAQSGERRIMFHRPSQLPFLFAGYHIPEGRHIDMAALDVAQRILSNGESSRIYKHCVYETQVASFAGGFNFELNDPGLFMAFIGVNQGREMEEAEKALFETIEGLAENPPTDRELQKAKNQIEAEYYFGLETASGKASALGEALVTYGDYLFMDKRLEQVREVTIEDVQRVVKKYFRPINRTTVIVVPDNEVDPVDFSDAGDAE